MSVDARRVVELSAEQAAVLDRLMAQGRFACESEAISSALCALEADQAFDQFPEQDEAFERFLRDEVAPVYDEMRAHPERAVPIEEAFRQVNSALRQHHEKRR